MKRLLFLSASFALAAASSLSSARPGSQATLPPLPAGDAAPGNPLPAGPTDGNDTSRPNPPGSPAPATAPVAASPAAAAPSPQQLYEHVRRGVVALERNGVPMAIGTVLDHDGRVLTSLSGLLGPDGIDIRYADGTSVHAKVGYGDKASDLALVVPQSGKWTEGLAASESDPVGLPLRAMIPSARSGHLGPAEAGIKGRVDARARDGGPVGSLLDIDVKGPLVAGAPLIDSTGTVVAVLVRACKGTPPSPAPQADSMPWAAWAASQDMAARASACAPAILGAPVSAIRTFLSATPASAAAPAAWLGIRGEAAQDGAVRGVRVVAVAPASPAQKGGLKPTADVIVAADGAPIDSPETLSGAIAKHAPGETVKLLVFGDGKFREAPIVLRQAP